MDYFRLMSILGTLLYAVLPALIGTIYVWVTRERWLSSASRANRQVPWLVGLALVATLVSLALRIF